jgi:hypothetical protein
VVAFAVPPRTTSAWATEKIAVPSTSCALEFARPPLVAVELASAESPDAEAVASEAVPPKVLVAVAFA